MDALLVRNVGREIPGLSYNYEGQIPYPENLNIYFHRPELKILTSLGNVGSGRIELLSGVDGMQARAPPKLASHSPQQTKLPLALWSKPSSFFS